MPLSHGRHLAAGRSAGTPPSSPPQPPVSTTDLCGDRVMHSGTSPLVSFLQGIEGRRHGCEQTDRGLRDACTFHTPAPQSLSCSPHLHIHPQFRAAAGGGLRQSLRDAHPQELLAAAVSVSPGRLSHCGRSPLLSMAGSLSLRLCKPLQVKNMDPGASPRDSARHSGPSDAQAYG